MREIYLNDIAHGRSGDKGDTSNICVFPHLCVTVHIGG